jgi:hypothetical protein
MQILSHFISQDSQGRQKYNNIMPKYFQQHTFLISGVF